MWYLIYITTVGEQQMSTIPNKSDYNYQLMNDTLLTKHYQHNQSEIQKPTPTAVPPQTLITIGNSMDEVLIKDSKYTNKMTQPTLITIGNNSVELISQNVFKNQNDMYQYTKDDIKPTNGSMKSLK